MYRLTNISISEDVKESLGNIGRSEDVKLSPNERRMVIAGFEKNKLLLIDVEFDFSGGGKRIALTKCIEITAPNLRKPHGLTFIDDETLVVANRDGDVFILGLPSGEDGVKEVELHPLNTIRNGPIHYVHNPGSVSVKQIAPDLHELLVCNNYVHYVTRHILDGRDQYRVISSAILLKDGLSIPDSIAENKGENWIAISNHNTHNVFLYGNTVKLNSQSRPDVTLCKIKYPHGLRFTSDNNFLLVADAGAPFVHVFSKGENDWGGVSEPVTSIRVMSDETYHNGNYNPQEGGPKGIEVESTMRVLIATSEHMVLEFFDLEKVLNELKSNQSIPDQADAKDKNWHQNKLSYDVENMRTILVRELERESVLHRTQETEQIRTLNESRSMKITAPLRWVSRIINP